jgi:hypothetical protein
MKPALLSLLADLPDVDYRDGEVRVPIGDDGRAVVAETTDGGAPYIVTVVAGEDGGPAILSGYTPCADDATAAEVIRQAVSV